MKVREGRREVRRGIKSCCVQRAAETDPTVTSGYLLLHPPSLPSSSCLSPSPSSCLPTPHLFQEVVLDVASGRVSLEVKVNIHVLAKPTGIIIPIGLGVSKCLHDLIGPNQHVGHPARAGMVG